MSNTLHVSVIKHNSTKEDLRYNMSFFKLINDSEPFP